VRIKYTFIFGAAILSLSNLTHSQLSLQNGNLVVYRVGNGATALSNSSTNISLLEFQQDGTLVQTINLPATGSDRLTSSGTATSEGKLRYNGRFLAVTGYDRDPGVSNIKDTTAADSPRRVRVFENNPLGTAQTVNFTGAFNEDNVRSAIPQGDGSGVWVTGHASNTTNGVWYHNFNTNTTTQIVSNENLRTVHIYNGQLYSGRASSGNNVQTVGTGLPTTATTLTNLPNDPTGRSLFIADLAGGSVMYVTTDSGTLTKYSLVGGNWQSNGTSATATGLGTVRDLTGYVDSSGNVRLFVITDGGTGGSSHLASITDTTGYNNSWNLIGFTSLATAGTNYAFRGITYVPEPSAIMTLSVLLLLGMAFVLRRSTLNSKVEQI
jgi:hypothetical protein